MANMAEDMSRIGDGIAASRRQRVELMAAVRKTNAERPAPVRAQLEAMRESRGRASRDERRTAAAHCRDRHSEMTSLLAQFGRQRAVTRQHALELAAAQREKAAAFMRDLTSGVAALRDGFSAGQQSRARDGRALAAAVQSRLAKYGQERRAAIAAWYSHVGSRMPLAGRRQSGHASPMVQPQPAAQAPAAQPPAEPAAAEASAMATPAPASTYASPAGQSVPSEPSGRSGRRGFGHHRSGEQHGEGEK